MTASAPSSGEITQLLAGLAADEKDLLDRVLPLIYQELHELAERALERERPDHTLQPTALVNEAYLRLAKQHAVHWQSRSHFMGVAATLMRRILVDHARARASKKRGGESSRIALDEALAEGAGEDMDLPALDEALRRLAELDPRQVKIVELRFFGGLSIEEAAELLALSPATVKREWSSAKAWLRRELSRS